jgi:hypothetical protein
LRYGTDGKFHPKLIDEDVMLDEPSFDRRSWIDTLNEMKVQYSELFNFGICTCDEVLIEYTTQQMQVDELQTLNVTNPKRGCIFNWEISSGGGSLSSNQGKSVVYTAPSSNENCEQNPIISLSVEGDVCDTLAIAVNAYVDDLDAYKIEWECMCEDCFEIGETVCGYECGTSWCFSCGHNYYNCNGTFRRAAYVHAGSNNPYELCLSWYATFCGDKTQNTVDLRSPTAKSAGCCPLELL